VTPGSGAGRTGLLDAIAASVRTTVASRRATLPIEAVARAASDCRPDGRHGNRSPATSLKTRP